MRKGGLHQPSSDYPSAQALRCLALSYVSNVVTIFTYVVFFASRMTSELRIFTSVIVAKLLPNVGRVIRANNIRRNVCLTGRHHQ